MLEIIPLAEFRGKQGHVVVKSCKQEYVKKRYMPSPVAGSFANVETRLDLFRLVL